MFASNECRLLSFLNTRGALLGRTQKLKLEHISYGRNPLQIIIKACTRFNLYETLHGMRGWVLSRYACRVKYIIFTR